MIFQNLSVIILIHLYAKICAKITQNHVSASHLIGICLDCYLNKIEIEIEIDEEKPCTNQLSSLFAPKTFFVV